MAAAQPNVLSGYSQAETLLRARHWDEGLTALAPLLKSSPNDPKVLNLVGLAFSGKGDPAQGSTYFVKALSMKPNFVPALKNLAVNELGSGQFQSAEGHLLTAEHEAPLDPVIQLYLGEISYEKHAFGPAVIHLEHAGASSLHDRSVAASLAISYLKTGGPSNQSKAVSMLDTLPATTVSPRFQLGIGLALAESDLPERAIPYLEAAQRTAPISVDVDYDLALCYLSAGQNTQAISTLQGITTQGHETAEVDNLLAEAYEKANQTQAAVDALRRAISLSPTDDDNYLDFASLCINHQDFSNATKVLDVALAVHPRSARLIFERGILNAMQDHFEQAEKDFQVSADLAPQDDSGYVALGVTYIETGNTAQAIQILRKRISEHSNDANLLYLLGEALIRSGAQPGDAAFTEAQAVTEKSIRLNPNLCEPHNSLGSIYLKGNRLQDAVDQLEQARRIDPSTKSAYSHLAIAYRRLGNLDQSRQMIALLQAINDRERGDPRQKMKDEGTAAPPPATQK